MRCPGRSNSRNAVIAFVLVLAACLAAQAAAPRFNVLKPSSTTGKPGFVRMETQTTGIAFTNTVPAERHYTNQIILNGSGVAAGDMDGDGWCDLFFAGLGGGSRLYRNEGNWKFQDVTAASGLGEVSGSFDATGTVLADLEGDGDLDLLINSVGQGTLSFTNNGAGRFSRTAVLNQGYCGTSLALGDVDGDGGLDIYIANYRTTTIRDLPGARFTFKEVNGRPQPVSFGGRPLTAPDLTNRFSFVYRPGAGGGGTVLHDELGEPDVLYRNQGGGRFTPASPGLFLDDQGNPLSESPLDWGLSVMMRDFNADGTPDIYVCNDFGTPDRFWLNDGKGRFRAAPTKAVRHSSLSTMAIDVADINRDGFDDFFTADMLSRDRWRRLVQHNVPNPNMHLFVDVVRQPQSARNTLQIARADGTYAEVAQFAGVEAAEWAWASIFLDADLDGYEDLLVANGFERDYMNMDAHRRVTAMQARAGRQTSLSEILQLNRHYPRLDTGNVAFHNLGDMRFADVSATWGFDQRAVSQGMCLADLDNDGDLDVAINNSNDAATILRNDSPAPRVAVRLKGKAPNTRGIGARIELLGGAVPSQSQEMISGGRYLSSDDPIRVFAAGATTNPMTLRITWRNGGRSIVQNVAANRIYEIDESGSGPAAERSRPRPAPMFEDVSALLNHKHSPESFDDFARQPLLPRTLSSLGPGVAWFDLDADGWDDLIVAGSTGATMAIYRNDRKGAFSRVSDAALNETLTRPQTAVLGAATGSGGALVLAGSSSYEDGATNGPVARQYILGLAGTNSSGGQLPGSFPGSSGATGPLALADVDGDGYLDLFVGGRCVPGRWPEAAPSWIFRHRQGKWQIDHENTQRVNLGQHAAGLVSAALFSDLDNDGDAELVLACEWGPLRIFRNDRGALTEATAELGLSGYNGWWNGVSAGDFDGDGRMDLVASNWGRNSKHERYRNKPLRIYYGDFNGDGGVIPIESWHDETVAGYAPILNVWSMSRSMPWLLEKFNSYEAFSRVTVEQALGGRAAKYLEASWLDSMVFLNRGTRFEAQPLPPEAQLSPAFGVCVADFNGDAHEDVFLSQNFFGTRSETSRYDAGRGLLLHGDGRGRFTAIPGHESGILLSGEQRGAAAADYDGDGRTDLIVTQVGDQTKLYRNETAASGVRVRLKGPTTNPHGIGAMLRWRSGSALGPAREVHAGSGYWSQDSGVQVMAVGRNTARTLQVRWPGGKVTEPQVPSDALEITVGFEGDIKRLR